MSVADLHDRIGAACVALRYRGERPVRIWLTFVDVWLLQIGQLGPCGACVRMRYMGLPVNVAYEPMRSRVVGASGVVEYV